MYWHLISLQTIQNSIMKWIGFYALIGNWFLLCWKCRRVGEISFSFPLTYSGNIDDDGGCGGGGEGAAVAGGDGVSGEATVLGNAKMLSFYMYVSYECGYFQSLSGSIIQSLTLRFTYALRPPPPPSICKLIIFCWKNEALSQKKLL